MLEDGTDLMQSEDAQYLEGMQDIDETVRAIADSVEIYLYE